MFNRFITPILVTIALVITGSAFYYAVNYGKQKAETKCEAEKVENTKDAQIEDRVTIKQREEADETVRNQDRSDFARDLSPEWVCGADCEI